MIIQCNSCQKSFTVPDSAIGPSGRLVQCSACGNKWTQFPINKKKDGIKIIKPKLDINQENQKIIKKKVAPPKKKKKKTVDTYSEEYLRKKHGIKIIDPSSSVTNKKIKNKINFKKIKTGFGFYSYILTLLVVLSALYGILNLTKDILISRYPKFEPYIYHFYETINNLKIIFLDLYNGLLS